MELKAIRKHANILIEMILSNYHLPNCTDEERAAYEWLKSLADKTPFERLQEELEKVDLEKKIEDAIKKIREKNPTPHVPIAPEPTPSPWPPYDPWDPYRKDRQPWKKEQPTPPYWDPMIMMYACPRVPYISYEDEVAISDWCTD